MSARGPTPQRPSLAGGYGIEDQTGPPGAELPWATVADWLTRARTYWLCTVRPDGRPHAKPLWALWHDEALIFSTHPESISGRNLRADPRATVHLEGRNVAVVEGDVQWLSDPPDGFVAAYEAKYRWRIDPADPTGALLALRPRSVLSWDEQRMPETMTRWSF